MALWFPDRKIIKPSAHVVDQIHTDFDQQAGLYDGHEIASTQLTPGPFRGRILTVTLEHVELYVEYKNQSVEQLTKPPTDRYSFRVLLESPGHFTNFGVTQKMDAVDVHPPGGDVAAINSAGSIQMGIAVDSRALLESEGLLPQVADWLHELGPRGAFITSGAVANRLRFLQSDFLEAASTCTAKDKLGLLSRFAVFQLASSLSLAWIVDDQLSATLSPITFDRFHNVRTTFQSLIEQRRQGEDVSIIRRELDALGSKRSVEQAFKASVEMGPLAYWKVMRLNNVRRKLLQPGRLHQTIADIAAEEGFWDPSKFGLYYQRLFGERASETRKRLDPDVLSRHRLPVGRPIE